MRSVLMSLAVAALLAAPALADESAKPDEPRKICRLQPAPTGSHRPGKRVCRTEAEWKARDSVLESYAQPDARTPISAGASGPDQ